MQALKHVPIGTTFTGVTHTGRAIPLGEVVGIMGWKERRHTCRWYDENGKHYEDFDLNNPAAEFREFKIIINEKED